MYIIFLVPFIFLAGCMDDESEIKSYVKKSLFDPQSVIWGDIEIIETKVGKLACVEFNAKNKMGGYSGRSAIPFTNLNNKGWSAVTDRGIPMHSCLDLINSQK